MAPMTIDDYTWPPQDNGDKLPWPSPPPGRFLPVSLPNWDPTKIVSLDTQAVGAGHGGTIPQLSRVTLVDYRGQIMFDLWIRPQSPVTGPPRNQTMAPEGVEALGFEEVQSLVGEVLEDKVIVGHSLWESLSILGLSHPASLTRDVELYWPFRLRLGTREHVRLASLVWHFMRRHIQRARIDSLENARAQIDLYRSVEREWEGYLQHNLWPCVLPPERWARCYT
ncbi:hypothetical protein DACRYDRAFT_95780 [Dacryopinax primogenitus]|uniref:Exonuclease domain-containing protein n=1 Tax=Dacryopinax primogenitus (strain DJM 731) TaxID=1858805 RepID=M5G881_DACPD|nr:uncharacterized protein DACRYDRAFT_95780 [Dacryopinax primogenitus]EJT99962.1 hypothetical protein DACRYDRAFT_95780 [Dacryopinax primogenitus]